LRIYITEVKLTKNLAVSNTFLVRSEVIRLLNFTKLGHKCEMKTELIVFAKKVFATK